MEKQAVDIVLENRWWRCANSGGAGTQQGYPTGKWQVLVTFLQFAEVPHCQDQVGLNDLNPDIGLLGVQDIMNKKTFGKT